MEWGRGAKALLAAVCLATLAGCNQNGSPTAAAPRGVTVAFESIDGPPQTQFRTLVQKLNDEAQSRRLAVISREQPSVYRVRGYLAAHVLKDSTTISWVWDVFDGQENRALRIAGEETAKGKQKDAWAAADDSMMQRIARTSMDQLAAFLTSPEATSGTQPAESEPAGTLVSSNGTSPEAAGIFRIPQAKVDPVSGSGAVPSASLAARETLSFSAQTR